MRLSWCCGAEHVQSCAHGSGYEGAAVWRAGPGRVLLARLGLAPTRSLDIACSRRAC